MDSSSGPAPGHEDVIMEIFTPEQINMILTELGYTRLAPPIADPVEGASGSVGPLPHDATYVPAQNESFSAGTTGQSTAFDNSMRLQPNAPYAMVSGNVKGYSLLRMATTHYYLKETFTGLNGMSSANLDFPIDPELLSSEPSQPKASTSGSTNRAYYYYPGPNGMHDNNQRQTSAAGSSSNEFFNTSAAGPPTVFNNLNQSYQCFEQNAPVYNTSEPLHGINGLTSAHPDIVIDPSLLMPAPTLPEVSTSGKHVQTNHSNPDSSGAYDDEQQDAFAAGLEHHEQSIKPRRIRSERHQGLTCPRKGKDCKYNGTFHDKRCLARHWNREHKSQPRPFLLCPGNCRDKEFSDEFSLHRHLGNENFVDCRREALNKGWIPTQQSPVKYLAD
ncbi:uncharacterized protein FOMMEDRAFT_30383 [Fomitiporia mediterranea MF3/22]|uniref:uncharacterized protein n=1 Tax=Fomitiporia mediterranea (strain MF3/22) TaxID=694068 RepID=UPI00044094BD|nr:uncharacterized protein FOMMEDRAFT_30383 [Fomitiporia mediterranea MF3/22]EJD00294.1 hypothetical protein FOMMEDRAFT_30383 [Fomitiporia mediterranea MF3/22]